MISSAVHSVRADLAVVEVHEGRQIELVTIHVKLSDICHLYLVWPGCTKVAVECLRSILETCRERFFARIIALSSIFCISRCTDLWLTGSAIQLHSAAAILQYP